jgi:predicted esterase
LDAKLVPADQGVFDEEDLVHRTHELADFIERAAPHYAFAADKIVAVGFSNGANIAASLLLLPPKTLRAAVLFRPMVPLVPEKLPDLSDVDVRISAGNQDPIIPASETRRLIELLRKAQARVTPSFVNAGHGLANGEVEGARRWLAELADGAR